MGGGSTSRALIPPLLGMRAGLPPPRVPCAVAKHRTPFWSYSFGSLARGRGPVPHRHRKRAPRPRRTSGGLRPRPSLGGTDKNSANGPKIHVGQIGPSPSQWHFFLAHGYPDYAEDNVTPTLSGRVAPPLGGGWKRSHIPVQPASWKGGSKRTESFPPSRNENECDSVPHHTLQRKVIRPLNSAISSPPPRGVLLRSPIVVSVQSRRRTTSGGWRQHPPIISGLAAPSHPPLPGHRGLGSRLRPRHRRRESLPGEPTVRIISQYRF